MTTALATRMPTLADLHDDPNIAEGVAEGIRQGGGQRTTEAAPLANTAGPMPIAPGYRFTDQAGRVVEILTLPTVSRPGRMRVIADEVNTHRVGKDVPYRLQQIRAHYERVATVEAKPGTSWKAPTGTVWEVVRKSKGAGGLVTVTVRSKAGAIRHFTLQEVESWEIVA